MHPHRFHCLTLAACRASSTGATLSNTAILSWSASKCFTRLVARGRASVSLPNRQVRRKGLAGKRERSKQLHLVI